MFNSFKKWFEDWFVGYPPRVYIAMVLLLISGILLVIAFITGSLVLAGLAFVALAGCSATIDRWKNGRYLFTLPRDDEMYELDK